MTAGDLRKTVLEEWAMSTATSLAPTLTHPERFKIAIGLLQARAQECRHLETELLLRAPGLLNQVERMTVRALAANLNDRMYRLEMFGMEMAKKFQEAEDAGGQTIPPSGTVVN